MESKPLVLYQNTAVTGIHVVDGRVSSVETTAGAIEAEVVVGAAGPQTGLMAEMVGVHVPGAPARVEMLTADPDKPRGRHRVGPWIRHHTRHGQGSGLGLGRFADVGPDWRQERGWVPAPCR